MALIVLVGSDTALLEGIAQSLADNDACRGFWPHEALLPVRLAMNKRRWIGRLKRTIFSR